MSTQQRWGLTARYQYALDQAQRKQLECAETAENDIAIGSHIVELQGGARITIRLEGDEITVAFSRLGKPVGDTELVTFKAYCSIPPTAERLPAGSAQTRILDKTITPHQYRHFVGFRWRRSAPAQQ